MVITNQDDMYIYFEIINQVEPNNVLDIGMFLKRIGAVSRHVMDLGIDADIRLDGVDYMSDMSVNVYKKIYDDILSCDTLMDNEDAYYDLVYLLRPQAIMTSKQEELWWTWLAGHAKYVVTDCNTQHRLDYVSSKGDFRDVEIDSSVYGIISF